MKVIKIFILATLLSGCSQGTEMDLSSPESYELTRQQIRLELKGEDREDFTRAIGVIAQDAYRGPDGYSVSDETAWAEFYKRLHGKNAEEILEMGSKLAR